MTGKRGLADRPFDFSAVARAHWQESRAYVQASRQPCIQIRDDEVDEIGGNRNIIRLGPGELHHIDVAGIWVLGVILCPGDDVTEVTEWVRMQGIDPGHVWFFLHSRTDLAVLQPWADAGYPTNQVDTVEDWEALHSVFGLYLSDYIYDAKGPSHSRTWTPGRRSKK